MLFPVIFLGYYASAPDAGYTLYNGAGGVVISRTTSGVVSLGNNAFQVVISTDDLPVPSTLVWDDGLGISADPIAYNGPVAFNGTIVLTADDLLPEGA